MSYQDPIEASAFYLLDANGERRAALQIDAEGNPQLLLYGRTGQPGVGIRLDSDDGIHIRIHDGTSTRAYMHAAREDAVSALLLDGQETGSMYVHVEAAGGSSANLMTENSFPTFEDLEFRIEQWFLQGRLRRLCPVCGHSEWEAGKILQFVDLAGPTAGYPVVRMACRECGHVLLFDAEKLGIVLRRNPGGQ